MLRRIAVRSPESLSHCNTYAPEHLSDCLSDYFLMIRNFTVAVLRGSGASLGNNPHTS